MFFARSTAAHCAVALAVATSSSAQEPTEYQWAGATSSTTLGDAGFLHLQWMCQAEYGPTARMCTSQEVLESTNLSTGSLPNTEAWTLPVYVPSSESALDMSGLGGDFEFTCDGWSSAGDAHGLTVTSEGRFRQSWCGLTRSVSCCTPKPAPTTAGPTQWAGATSTTFDGAGNGGGYFAISEACRTEVGDGARPCSSVEILESTAISPGDVPPGGCWIRPTFTHTPLRGRDLANGHSNAGQYQTCLGWGDNSDLPAGLSIDPAGRFIYQSCAESRAVACCAPVPVPEPDSSSLFPVGVVTIALMRRRDSAFRGRQQ